MKKYRKLYIEITNRCNLSCSFCPQTSRKAKTMSAAEFETVAEKVQGRAQNFYLHVMGEPTAHPHLDQILSICRKYNMTVNITTNGTLLDRVGDLLIKSGVRSVSVSLHSFEANTLTKSMADYLDTVIGFCKKALGRKTVVELRLWNFDLDSIYDKNMLNRQILDYLQARLQPENPIFDSVEKTLIDMRSSNQRKFNIRIKDNIFLGMAEHFDWPDINKTDRFCDGFCYGLRNQVAVLADGTVVPCCLDSEGVINLGNIFERDLDEIINSDRAKRIYDGFSQRKATEPLCQTCGYMKMHLKK